jgi:hypothetical protein
MLSALSPHYRILYGVEGKVMDIYHICHTALYYKGFDGFS